MYAFRRKRVFEAEKEIGDDLRRKSGYRCVIPIAETSVGREKQDIVPRKGEKIKSIRS